MTIAVLQKDVKDPSVADEQLFPHSPHRHWHVRYLNPSIRPVDEGPSPFIVVVVHVADRSIDCRRHVVHAKEKVEAVRSFFDWDSVPSLRVRNTQSTH
jgi:hypothetical protein